MKFRGGWRVRYFDESGKRKSGGVFPTLKEAMVEQRLREAHVEEIKRGLRSPTPGDHTFNELCDYWIAKVLPQKRSGKKDQSIIRAHLRPTFGNQHLREIGRQHIDEYKLQRRHLDNKTIHNQLTLMISMMNVAVEMNWLVKAPKIKKPKVRIFNKDYRYLKNKEEVDRFLRSAFVEGEGVFMLYATAVYTGARAGELAALERDDINFDQRLITIQRGLNGPCKAEDIRRVPILDPLLPLLREWLLKTPGRLVFPNEAGHRHQESARVFQETLHRVLERGEFPKVLIKNKERHYITFHGLRHTFASYWMMNGGLIDRLKRILGHKSVAMTERYSHLSPQAFAEDYSRLGASAPNCSLAEVLPLKSQT